MVSGWRLHSGRWKLLGLWLGVWIIQSVLMSGGRAVEFYLLKNVVLVGLQASLVAINWYVLIPRLWQKRQFLIYSWVGMLLIYLVFTVSFPLIDLVFSTFTDIKSNQLGPWIWVTDFWRILSGSALYSLAFLCSLVVFLFREKEPGMPVEKQLIPDRIVLKDGHKTHLIALNEVYFIEGLREYVTWHTSQGKIVVLQSLSQIETTYASKGFLRVHKSFVVNMRQVELLDGARLRIGTHYIPVGRKYKPMVHAYFSETSLIS